MPQLPDWAVPAETRAVPTIDVLFREYADTVLRLVGRLLGPGASADDVDDVVQEVFITVDRVLHRYRGEGTLFSFIYGVTVRVVLRFLRSRRRYRRMIERFETASTGQPASYPNPEETTEQREQVHAVWRALLRLRADRRLVFLLFHVEGLTAHEIATTLKLTEETVRYRLRCARTELQGHLARQRGQRP